MKYIMTEQDVTYPEIQNISIDQLPEILNSESTLIVEGTLCAPVLAQLASLDYDLLGTLICIHPDAKACESLHFDAIYTRVIHRGVMGSQTVAIWLHAECIETDVKTWYESRVRLIDSHAHVVSDALYPNIHELVGETRVNVMCGSLQEVERGLMLGDQYNISIGVHPTSVADVSKDEFEAMMSYTNHSKVIAVGEIGLDYYWETETKEMQISMFKKQIEIANRFKLPIVVHVRESIEDVYNILLTHEVHAKGVIHCFTYDAEWAKKFVALGYYIGVGGIVTFKNGQNVRDIVEAVPLERLLLETDSPYLAPVPMRGKENRPSYVTYVYQAVCDLRSLEMDALKILMSENYKMCFRKA